MPGPGIKGASMTPFMPRPGINDGHCAYISIYQSPKKIFFHSNRKEDFPLAQQNLRLQPHSLSLDDAGLPLIHRPTGESPQSAEQRASARAPKKGKKNHHHYRKTHLSISCQQNEYAVVKTIGGRGDGEPMDVLEKIG